MVVVDPNLIIQYNIETDLDTEISKIELSGARVETYIKDKLIILNSGEFSEVIAPNYRITVKLPGFMTGYKAGNFYIINFTPESKDTQKFSFAVGKNGIVYVGGSKTFYEINLNIWNTLQYVEEGILKGTEEG